MKAVAFLAMCFIFLAAIGCRRVRKPDPNIAPDWEKLKLRNGWILFAPKGFISKESMGVDSEPGIVYSPKDSVGFQYDTGQPNFDCKNGSFDEIYARERKQIDTGYYNTIYDKTTQHKAVIDTVDNQIAIIITPKKIGEGMVSIEISNCDHAWVGLNANNVSLKTQNLLLRIFRTLKYEGK